MWFSFYAYYYQVCAYFIFFPEVFFHSRVIRPCPATTHCVVLWRRVNLTITTSTTTETTQICKCFSSPCSFSLCSSASAPCWGGRSRRHNSSKHQQQHQPQRNLFAAAVVVIRSAWQCAALPISFPTASMLVSAASIPTGQPPNPSTPSA